MSKPKYQKSELIKTLDEFIEQYQLQNGIYYRDKYEPVKWYENWSLIQIQRYIDNNYLSKAEEL